MSQYNHLCDIGFVVISNDPHGATDEEILDAIKSRIKNLENNSMEIQEAVDFIDTFEIEK
jgi:hypothetical protein